MGKQWHQLHLGAARAWLAGWVARPASAPTAALLIGPLQAGPRQCLSMWESKPSQTSLQAPVVTCIILRLPPAAAVDHRVATHKGERRRVEAMGNTIAPIDFSGSGVHPVEHATVCAAYGGPPYAGSHSYHAGRLHDPIQPFHCICPAGPATRVDRGVGPLRIWPGGLCLSRAIGDFDVGDSVIPFPHVMQASAGVAGLGWSGLLDL